MSPAEARRRGIITDVRAISQRGEFSIMDMLGNSSILNTLKVYKGLKNS
jgi:hypothetical protein